MLYWLYVDDPRHYHSMEVFAHYDLMDSAGNRLAEGSKASFCLEDTVCDKGTKPKYNCKGFSDQGHYIIFVCLFIFLFVSLIF